MQQTVITAEMREKAGQRGTLTKLRAAGRVPAVIYGQDKKPAVVTVDEKTLTALVRKDMNAILKIKYDSAEDVVIIKAMQRHPLTERPTHFDFQRISLTEKIKVKVHVKLTGECYGVKVQAGLVEHTMRELHVLCLPTEIPHEIVVDITDLHINNSLRVKDVKVEKAELVDNPEQIVVSVTAPKEEKVETPAAGAAAGTEPEVVAAKGKKEEEGAAPAAGAKPAAGAPAADKKAEPKK